MLQGPPTMFGSLIDAVDGGAPTPRTLQVAVTGSAVIPPALLRRMVSTLGIRQVHAGYGLTETTGVCTITRARRPARSGGRELRACDRGRGGPHRRRRRPDGCRPGRGARSSSADPGTMVGYLDDPAATAETISADGWLATGRRRLARRRRQPPHRRPHQGPDHRRRIQHLTGRDRARAGGASARSRRRRSSAFPTGGSARSRARSSFPWAAPRSTKPSCSPGPHERLAGYKGPRGSTSSTSCP